jgi:hypothetical protein
MENSNFQLILTEPNGNFATPDITTGSSFETSFSIQSASDISLRKDTIAKNITFPGTKNNNRIFNNLFSFNRASNSDIAETLFYNYSPNVAVRAVLYENNFPIVVGSLKINDIIRDNTGGYVYTGVLTGVLVSFFSSIKDQLLTDLSGFNTSESYTINDIINSWNFEIEDRFLFPMIDYGKGQVQRRDKFDIRNIRPAIYLRYYIKAILASQGYKYKSSFIDSDIFNRIFVPFSDAEFGKTVFGDVLTIPGVDYSSNIGGSNSFGIFFGFDSFKWGNMPSNNFINIQRNVNVLLHTDTSSALKDNSHSSDIFTFTKYTTTSLNINIRFTISNDSTTTNRVGIYQLDNGKILFENAIDYRDIVLNGGSVNWDLDLKLPYGDYEKGFTFGVFMIVIGSDNIDFTERESVITIGDTDPARGSFFTYDLGENFQLTDAIPKNQKAVDFLKSVFQVFNLYAIENPDDNKELIIEPYDIFYIKAANPKEYALNWTKKVDNKTLHIKINTQLPKSYEFAFKADSDYYNTLYKNTYNSNYGDFSIQNKNGSADTKKIEATFSPTIVVRETGDDKTLPAIFTGEVNAKKSFKSNLRLLFNNGSKSCTSFDISNITNGNYNILKPGLNEYQLSHTVLTIDNVDLFSLLFGTPKAVYYPVDGSIFDLPTLFSELYSNQLAEINDDNIFTLEIDGDLKETDVANLDLRTPIFISTIQGDAYFKVIDITYYNRQEISKITLQKIIL